jgi:hypothetical protein
MVQGVVETEGKAHHQHRTADLYLIEFGKQVLSREGSLSSARTGLIPIRRDHAQA